MRVDQKADRAQHWEGYKPLGQEDPQTEEPCWEGEEGEEGEEEEQPLFKFHSHTLEGQLYEVS